MSTPTISAIPNIRSRTALSGTRTRTQIVAPELRIADGPSATVLRIARSRGPLSRDTAAKASAEHRHREPAGHEPAGPRDPARTRGPDGLRSNRASASSVRGQPRALSDSRHPHRCRRHQHHCQRHSRKGARRRRDSDACHQFCCRACHDCALGQILCLAVAQASSACRRRGHRRSRRFSDRSRRSPASGMEGRQGRPSSEPAWISLYR